MIDAIYPLGTGSLLKNEEIRFSLRSLVANASNLGKVLIVGAKPGFLKWSERLIHVPFVERHTAYRNVWEKLHFIARSDLISETFLFLNDDFIIVKQFDAAAIPNCVVGGDLAQMTTTNGKRLGSILIADVTRSYHRVLKHTLMVLKQRGMTSYNFATHQPVLFEKGKVIECYKEFEKDLAKPYGLSWRCCYGNMFNMPRVARPTHVIRTRFHVPAGRLAVALHKDIDPEMFRRRLTAMFSKPSMFETP